MSERDHKPDNLANITRASRDEIDALAGQYLRERDEARAQLAEARRLIEDASRYPGSFAGAEQFRTECAAWLERDTQPCGHPRSAIVSSDEGTHYCGACAKEAGH